mmetsp:Transcript_41504/g.96566  ORF Transcript_41504/g.96566 Transcript_41504/m.96566 type:complete len:420 (-) Transcript_41504:136-1395(-)
MTFNIFGQLGHEMFDVDRMKADEKWLFFVCGITFLVLVFQVVAGAIGKSDALIADSAHSSVDLVTYFMNFYIEYRKNKTRGALQDNEKHKLDMRGSFFSTFLLCSATGWACKEAIERLSMSGDLKPAANYSGIGPSMLAFSVISTAANVFTLWVHGTGAFEKDFFGPRRGDIELPGISPAGSPTSPSHQDYSAIPYKAYTSPKSSSPKASSPRALNDIQNTPPDMAASLNDMPDGRDAFRMSRLDPDAKRARDERKRLRAQARKQGGLNLTADFNDASPCNDQSCTSAACNSHSHAGSNAFLNLVHQIVHPGCGRRDGQGAQEHNLNVFGAVLHLVADVLRSVAILIVAIFIQMGWVSDPADADAVCALFVAAFVLLGSLTLFFQMASTSWHLATAEEEPGNGLDLELGEPISSELSYL